MIGAKDDLIYAIQGALPHRKTIDHHFSLLYHPAYWHIDIGWYKLIIPILINTSLRWLIVGKRIKFYKIFPSPGSYLDPQFLILEFQSWWGISSWTSWKYSFFRILLWRSDTRLFAIRNLLLYACTQSIFCNRMPLGY